MQISKCKITIENWKLPLGIRIENYKSKGYVTITVLILMMVLSAITYLFADAIYGELAIARNNKGAQAAFALAEAGIQEAIYRVQYDTETRTNFLNGSPDTTFEHNPALLPNGRYTVTIDNLSQGVAKITSTGYYTIGLRTAKRVTQLDIAQATQPPDYPYDGAIFGAGGAGESIADIRFEYATVKIYGGSILSNRNIELVFGANVDVEKTVEASTDVNVSGAPLTSHLDCNCLINDDGDPLTLQCSPPPGCTPQEGIPKKSMPQIDFETYKTIAWNTPGPSPDGNQYFINQQAFKAIFPAWTERTFEGVYYIDSSLDIDDWRTMRMKGVLATSGSITVGHTSNLFKFGQILVEPLTVGGASGIITQGSFKVKTIGHFSGTGLVYAGDSFEMDASIPYSLNLTGGILSRRTRFQGFRIVNIHFDANVINTALADPTDTPVIELNHWEEEY